MAAFWPHEFFSSNLGTLSELNKWFTYIMLFFIPAITMSIWAEERRQGTDELLLTLPAADFDIVIGKYVAAAAIYTVSLLFSQFSTFLVLAFLTNGEVDTGLFFSNYVGYWLIGLAMIAIGMVASFLTNNLTVGFILGALFNAPLAFAAASDTIIGRGWARDIKGFSLAERFDDFGRGIISLSGLAYFLLLASFGVYLCMILIGKRHWNSGKDGNKTLLGPSTDVVGDRDRRKFVVPQSRQTIRRNGIASQFVVECDHGYDPQPWKRTRHRRRCLHLGRRSRDVREDQSRIGFFVEGI
jgi:ABC-2 type transport system permease protein